MKKFTLNDILIIGMIVILISGVMLLSFSVKSLRYAQTNGVIELQVQKKIFTVYAQTNGTLMSSSVYVGQHIKKGDLVGLLTNQTLDKQISFLQSIDDNTSASIQLEQLQVEKAAQTLYSPTDGVVAEIASEGESINNVQKVATIYSDKAVQLIGNFSYANYTHFQENTSNLSALDNRNHQTYELEYGGTLQDVGVDDNKQNYVSLFFTFKNPNDAVNILQNERLYLPVVRQNEASKPIDSVIKFYKNSIFNLN